MPEKDSPFEKFDYGLVVFTGEAKETIVDRWSGSTGALTPVQLPPDKEYLPDLINRLPGNPCLSRLLAMEPVKDFRFQEYKRDLPIQRL